jgi:hypothetical protein
MSTQRTIRLAYLGSYLRELINDVQAQGKVAKIDGNPVEVAAVALLSGSIAVAKEFLADVETLAGHARDHAKVVGPPLAARVAGDLATRGVGLLLGKVFGGSKTK